VSNSRHFNVAIAGATGAVGAEFLKVLADRKFPIANLKLLASARSAGKTLMFDGKPYTVEELTEHSFQDVDIALFSAGGSQSKKYADAAVRAGAVVVDNSSAFRMDPRHPLVVPEVNPEDIGTHQGIIANPNCSTIIMLMAVYPLTKLGRIKRIVVSTYQAASGAGAAGMDELVEQTREYLAEKSLTKKVFPHQYAFNLFSHNSPVTENGYNEEEMKMMKETRKILHDDQIGVTATCVRVPVLRAHSEAINIEFEGARPSLEAIRDALAAFPGVQVRDDRAANHFPMPIEVSDNYDCFVGRIRNDLSNERAVDLFVAGDQVLKGAALNAVQIAEVLIEKFMPAKK
jgi:aspartate-semialdehyde dehydrogenase